MKRKLFNRIAALILISLGTSFSACSQTRVLSDLPSGNGVEKVYLGKALVNMGLQNLNNSFCFEGLSGGVQGIEVYSCENGELTASVKDKIDEVLRKFNAEVMIETEEDGETSIIYNIYEDKDKKNPIGMAVIEYEGNEINVVILHGAFIQ